MSGSKVIGQDVRFVSNHCWVWWPYLFSENGRNNSAECIDGETGLRPNPFSGSGAIEGDESVYSKVSTFDLTSLYLKLLNSIDKAPGYDEEKPFSSLSQLKSLKLNVSQQHEEVKSYFFKTDKTFRHWSRRGRKNDC